jgi:hypothetical protein
MLNLHTDQLFASDETMSTDPYQQADVSAAIYKPQNKTKHRKGVGWCG